MSPATARPGRLGAALALLLGLAALAGCLSSGTQAPPEDDGDAAPATASLASFVHSLSDRDEALTFSLAIVEQYRTTVPNLGVPVEIDTWIVRPDTDAPVPVVLEVTPYYGGGQPTGVGRLAQELLPHGYAVGVSSVRGTGNSGGCFTQAGPEEARDTAAVIEHIAAQPWSNGNVGLIGVSYPGTTPQDVWVEAPPSLKAIVPISGISDMYKYNFVNGVHINPQGWAFNAYYWVFVGPAFNPTDVATVPGAIAGEVCADQVDVQLGGAYSALTGDKHDYWQVRDFGAEYLAAPEAERAAVFFIHGLQDWNVKPHMMEDWLDLLWDSGVPMKVWLGQWAHAWPAHTNPDNLCEYDEANDRGRACRADWWNVTLVAWFDEFLKGIDTGILDAPRVQVQDDQGRWRHEDIWPPRDADILRLHLDGSGLTAGPGGSGSGTFVDFAGSTPPQVPMSRFFLRSEPVAENLTVSGMPVLHANVTAGTSRAHVVVTLFEESPSGTMRAINFGIQSLNHIRSLEQGDPDVRGVRQEMHLRLFPQDDVIREGHRIVLGFAGNTLGGPGPALLPGSGPTQVTVDFAGAWLELPVDRSLHYEDPQPYVVLDEVAA